MKIADLFAKIGFEVDEAPLKALSRQLDDLKSNIVSVGNAVNTMKTIMEVALGVEIVKKLFDVSEKFAEWGQNLKVTSATLGVTTDEIQKLSYAASQSGVSTEEMTHSLAHLSRHIYDAKNGSKEAADAFYKAGITFDQVQGFTSAEQALSVLSDRVAAVKDPMQRLGLAQALLGRGGYQMVAFLSKGSAAFKAQGEEAKKLGLVISGPQINNLEAMAKGFQRLHLFLQEIGAYIASYFGPVFTLVIDKMIAFYNANRKLIDLELSTWLNRVASTLGFLSAVMIRAGQWALYLVRVIHDLYASLDQTPLWGRGLPPWAVAIKEFFESFGIGGKGGIRLSDIFKGENAGQLSALLDGILLKAKEKVKSVFKDLFGTGADQSVLAGLGKSVGDLLIAALITSGFAVELGKAIITGMLDAISEKLFGGTDKGRTSVGDAGSTGGAAKGDFLNRAGLALLGGGQSGDSLSSIAVDAFNSLPPGAKAGIGLLFSGGSLAGAAAGAAAGVAGTAGADATWQGNTYHMPITVTAAPGANGTAIAADIHKEMQRRIDEHDKANRQRASQDQQAQASVGQ